MYILNKILWENKNNKLEEVWYKQEIMLVIMV